MRVAKKKIEMMEVRITGPDCRDNDRQYWPGETVTVPAELAREWIQSERAVSVAAEVKQDG
jgi:hypothetical protein